MLCGADGCPRKWAFRYIDRVQLDPEDAPWKGSGVRMHAYLERAKKTGKTPPQDIPEARVASSAIQYWPENDPEGEAPEWSAEVDIEVARPTWILRGHADQLGKGFFGDYKFTGNKRNLPEKRCYWERDIWKRDLRGKGSDAEVIEDAVAALADDPQVIGYGSAALHLGRAWGRWTYVIKPPKLEGEPKILLVDFQKSAKEIEVGMQYLDRVASLATYLKANYQAAKDVPCRPRACGGVKLCCDYEDSCEINKGPSMKTTQTIEDLMSEFGIEKNGANPPEARKRRIEEEEAEEEEEEAPRRKKKAAKKIAAPRKLRKAVEEEEEEVEEAEEEAEEVAPRKLRKRKAVEEAEEEEEHEAATRKLLNAGTMMIIGHGTFGHLKYALVLGCNLPVGTNLRSC